MHFNETIPKKAGANVALKKIASVCMDHEKVNLNCNNFFTVDTYNKTRSNGLKLEYEKPRLDIRKYRFSVRTAKIWNQLPSSIVLAKSLEIFRTELNKFDLSRFTSGGHLADLNDRGLFVHHNVLLSQHVLCNELMFRTYLTFVFELSVFSGVLILVVVYISRFVVRINWLIDWLFAYSAYIAR